MNYKIKESLIIENGYTNLYVVFKYNGHETTVTEYTKGIDGLYTFKFTNSALHLMNSTVEATLYASQNGVEYSIPKSYSIATYCYNMLSKYNADEYAEFRTLLVDLLNFGAALQVYTNDTNELANERLTDEQASWGTLTDREYVNITDGKYATIDNPTVTLKGASLSISNNVGINVKIEAENIEGLVMKIWTDSGKEWFISSEKFFYDSTTNRYVIGFKGLNASQMNDAVYIVTYNGDTIVSNTTRYSIESYVSSKMSNTNVNFVNMLKAMMKYGDSAKRYIYQ